MTEFNKKVKWIAGDLLDVILTAVSYIFVTAAFVLKFVILFIGISIILAFLYSEVFGGNAEAVFTLHGLIFTFVLTGVYWVADYTVANLV